MVDPTHSNRIQAALFPKQIRMSPRAFEAHHFSRHFVNQQPVQFDVRITISTPTTFQRMIEVDRWQRFPLNQQSSAFSFSMSLPRFVPASHRA